MPDQHLEYFRPGDDCMELVISGDEKDLVRLSDGRFTLVRKITDKQVHRFFSVLSAYTFMKLDQWGFYSKRDMT